MRENQEKSYNSSVRFGVCAVRPNTQTSVAQRRAFRSTETSKTNAKNVIKWLIYHKWLTIYCNGLNIDFERTFRRQGWSPIGTPLDSWLGWAPDATSALIWSCQIWNTWQINRQSVSIFSKMMRVWYISLWDPGRLCAHSTRQWLLLPNTKALINTVLNHFGGIAAKTNRILQVFADIKEGVGSSLHTVNTKRKNFWGVLCICLMNRYSSLVS